MSKINKLRKDEKGQILVISVLVLLMLVVFIYAVFNVGQMVSEKMRMQNIADSAAYSGAVWEARLLNFTAYTNRALIANIVMGSFITAMQSNSDAWNRLRFVSYFCIPIPGVGSIIGTLATVYKQIADALGSTPICSKFIPQSNKLLLDAQGGLFQAVIGTPSNYGGLINQTMNDIAKFMDKDVELYPSTKKAFIDKTLNTAVFNQNYTSLYNVAILGNWQDIAKVTNATITSWTKGTESGTFFPPPVIPPDVFNKRDWKLLPDWMATGLACVLCTPANYKINGSIQFDPNFIRTSDSVSTIRNKKVYGIPIPCTEKNVNIGNYSKTWTQADLNDWGTMLRKMDKSKPISEKEPSVWVVVKKKKRKLEKKLLKFKASLNPTKKGIRERFDINKHVDDLYAVARGQAVYRDPVTGLGPNLFNPFWEATLATASGNPPGFSPIFIAINSGFGNALPATESILH
jgi:hypothetical protein